MGGSLSADGGLAGAILKETGKIRLRTRTRACFGGRVRLGTCQVEGVAAHAGVLRAFPYIEANKANGPS